MQFKRKNGKFRKKGKYPSQDKSKDTKGFWEYSNNQKIVIENKEEEIKRNLRFLGGFNPNKVKDYLDPLKSKEELIEEKVNNGIKLSKGEKIIFDATKSKKERVINKDLELLDLYKLNADVTTEEGKIRKLLLTLEYVVNKKDNVMVSLIYLKLKDKVISEDLLKKYSSLLSRMNQIVADENIIELQMTKLHSCQPPLDKTGFSKLDEFQVDVINNIDNNISTIVSAPTSSGKSVISGYAFTKGKTLVVVPSDPLAWQMSSYIGRILDKSIPIITKSYQTSPKRDELIDKVNKANSLVGTADAILDFLPLLKIDFDWIVFDEIHMIGKKEGSSMEHLARLYHNKPFLALSATIGNIDDLKDWFQSVSSTPISVVNCKKRFFNLQRYYYSTDKDKLNRIHPLSMVSGEDFGNKSILTKTLQPTPPDIWDFATKLSKIVNLGNLNPSKYFNKEIRITLDMSNEYFDSLIKEVIKLYKGKSIPKINKLIESYKINLVRTEEVNLMNLLFNLKNSKKCPAIVFQANSTSCMRLARQLARQINEAEKEKYPKLVEEREKEEKKAKKLEKEQEKKLESLKTTGDKVAENKKFKMQMTEGTDADKSSEIDIPLVVPVQEPHSDFILNNDQLFTGAVADKWARSLKKYFPNNRDEYHWLIIMLWRGVGVYVKGLPDDYLRLVQELASLKKLAVVFSDESLVFGVSMPFRTTVVLRDTITEDTLDPMMYQQMSGRAGRRGLDTEGNVIFAGYSGARIEELSISSLPDIKGMDTMVYPVDVATKLGEIYGNKLNWNLMKTNFLHEKVTNELADDFYNDISENTNEGGGWEFLLDESKNHNHMVWKLRHDTDCISISMILPEFKKIFDVVDPNIEKNQIEASLFLSNFINLEPASEEDDYILPESSYLKNGMASNLKEYADNIGLEIPERIDGKVYETIVKNKLVNLGSELKNDKLRDRLFEFSEKVRCIQHYFFHSETITVARLLGKLLTRIWWCFHLSSPLMKSIKNYEETFELEDSDEYSEDESEED